jgi:hypothetical protein
MEQVKTFFNNCWGWICGASTSMGVWLTNVPVPNAEISNSQFYGFKLLFTVLMALIGGALGEVARQEVIKFYKRKNKKA